MGTFGAQVTGVRGTAKTGLVRSIGAGDVMDYTRDDFADRREDRRHIRSTTGIQRLDRAGQPLGGAGWCQRVPRGSGLALGSAG